MMGYEIKGKTAIGTEKKVTGKVEILKEAEPSFKSLSGNLRGKILVCPGEISKGVLEKARALGVLGIVGRKITEEHLFSLKKELRSSWSSASFALLIVEEETEKILPKIEGKIATIEVEKKRLVIEK